MQQEFMTPQGRMVTIKFDNDAILFYWSDAIHAQNNFIENQEELGNDIDEDDRKVSEFYWIYKDEWISDITGRQDRSDNWHVHMKEKTWFTEQMYNWINKNV